MFHSPLREQAAAVYSQLMAQARHPWFYTQAAVPDTLDGRFEMLVLHLFAYVNLSQELPTEQGDARSEGESEARGSIPHPLARAVTELMIDDMDRSLREMGVGDMGVSRRIKQMGNAINGRFHAYEAALAEGNLTQALTRNVYGTVKPEEIREEAVQALEGYVTGMMAHLQTHQDFTGFTPGARNS